MYVWFSEDSGDITVCNVGLFMYLDHLYSQVETRCIRTLVD